MWLDLRATREDEGTVRMRSKPPVDERMAADQGGEGKTKPITLKGVPRLPNRTLWYSNGHEDTMASCLFIKLAARWYWLERGARHILSARCDIISLGL